MKNVEYKKSTLHMNNKLNDLKPIKKIQPFKNIQPQKIIQGFAAIVIGDIFPSIFRYFPSIYLLFQQKDFFYQSFHMNDHVAQITF